MELADEKIPDGFWKIEAYTNGYQIVVVGTPLGEDELGFAYDEWDEWAHDCDRMGCGTFSHVIARIPIMHRPSRELWPKYNLPAPKQPQQQGAAVRRIWDE